jgi:hypothetical protein
VPAGETLTHALRFPPAFPVGKRARLSPKHYDKRTRQGFCLAPDAQNFDSDHQSGHFLPVFAAVFPALGRLAPYLERACIRPETPWVSSVPRMMW